MWRPKEAVWIKVKREHCGEGILAEADCKHCPTTPMKCDTSFEAGADAMLEALKEKSPLMTPGQMKLMAPDRQYPYGWLVFIEEE